MTGKFNLKTPITYYGGKQTMLKHILPLIPEHIVYTEAFAGGAAVLFAKQPSKVEVINDLNGELINFYRVCKLNFEALKIEIDMSIHARAMHEHSNYVYKHPVFFNPVQRAWAVWYSAKTSFASMLGESFGYDRKKGQKAIQMRNAKDNFAEWLRDRLEHITIECDDALKVIKRFDCEHAFHFIDPPYIYSDMGHYGGMFNEQNMVELLELCATLKGKFMLTMYPCDLIQKYVDAHGWKIHAVERTITASKVIDKRRRQVEWMVCNY
ncbi:MAG: DNA adenine methylase [Bacteroidetes bacterium]|nr:DNA adenine methylase [Bacteroidota bacterium]